MQVIKHETIYEAFKNSSVIFEGPDRCGKSTQVENLKNLFLNENLMTHVFHYSSVKTKDVIKTSKELYEDGFRIIKDNQLNYDNRVLLFDRFHGGEWVYGKIYRGYDADFIYSLEREWNIQKTKLIVLIDEPEKLLLREDGQSLSNNQDVAVQLQNKKYEIDRFVDFFNKSTISNKILINIKNKTEKDVFGEIKKFLNIVEEQ